MWPCVDDEADRIDRIDRGEHREIVAEMHGAGDRDGDEPDHHDRTEERRHPRGAAALHREQRDQDDDGERHHVVLERRRRQLQPLDRRQHRDRRRDHRVAEEHRRADDAEQQHDTGAPPERARGQRGERQRAALAVVVGAQQDQHVFDGDDDISAHRISDSTPSTVSRVTGPDSAAAITATRKA